MKKIYAIIAILFLSSISKAQVYPYLQDFEGYPAFSAPGDWVHTIASFQIYSTHGVNSSKALSREFFNLSQSDSIISPLIGSINSLSQLTFDYRIVQYIGATPLPVSLSAGENLEIKIDTGGLNVTTIYTIDMNNHVDSAGFANVSVSLAAFAGTNIGIMIKGKSVTGDFFIDIDNFNVQNTTSVPDINSKDETVSFYPNPVKENLTLQSKINSIVHIYDVTGRLVYTTIIKDTKSIIQTGFLNKGEYILEVISNNNTRHRENFIKE